jgi:hypothetical protein
MRTMIKFKKRFLYFLKNLFSIKSKFKKRFFTFF